MKEKILFITRLIFGLMFINAGLNKFFNYMPVPEEMPERALQVMQAYMTIVWLMPLVGVFEIIGGVLFIFRKTSAIGAIVILPIMVGILLTNLIDVPSGLPIAAVLFLINIWVIYDNRDKYRVLLST
ncbi:MAG TPA: DoxX family protein [Saprospiraceae bacterium]|nr:DoxX family protein [Lewinellaceae bacterium]HQU53262.1 DoxX family protein [Saprospiraceae bacterium]HRV83585.1 DoxX family protein [Saprospiraceae bacterium]